MVYQPLRTRDGVLHVQPGESVTVFLPDGDRTSVAAGREGGNPAPESSNPWGTPEARTVIVTVVDTAHLQLDVAFRLTNRSGSTLYAGGSYARLERWSGREWQHAWGGFTSLLGGGGVPTVLATGATITGTIHAPHLTTAACYPCFLVDPIPGTYRLTFDLYRTLNANGIELGDPLPEETAVSNTFTVVAP